MDIKPNNIMFSHSGRSNLHVKIIDFGLARELGGLGRAKCGIVGTVRREYVVDVLLNRNSLVKLFLKNISYLLQVEFMSPEVVAGSFAVAASDLWSFGVMLFMMVSGGLSPFWAGNDYKTEARVLGGLQQTLVTKVSTKFRGHFHNVRRRPGRRRQLAKNMFYFTTK